MNKSRGSPWAGAVGPPLVLALVMCLALAGGGCSTLWTEADRTEFIESAVVVVEEKAKVAAQAAAAILVREVLEKAVNAGLPPTVFEKLDGILTTAAGGLVDRAVKLVSDKLRAELEKYLPKGYKPKPQAYAEADRTTRNRWELVARKRARYQLERLEITTPAGFPAGDT